MIELNPIGIIHSPFPEREGTPRQAAGAGEVEATLEIYSQFVEGLKDLDGFSHILILFRMHLIDKFSMTANPPWDNQPHGVFATCSPFRPNPIGVSVVRLLQIKNAELRIAGVDMVDLSPVLDIKPYVPSLFPSEGVRIGWLTGKEHLQNMSRAGEK